MRSLILVMYTVSLPVLVNCVEPGADDVGGSGLSPIEVGGEAHLPLPGDQAQEESDCIPECVDSQVLMTCTSEGRVAVACDSGCLPGNVVGNHEARCFDSSLGFNTADLLANKVSDVPSTLRISTNTHAGGANDSGWTLDSGTGSRTTDYYVSFGTDYSQAPHVSVSLSGVDMIDGANHRLNVSVATVYTHGFLLRYGTWSDTRVWWASVSWTALGSP